MLRATLGALTLGAILAISGGCADSSAASASQKGDEKGDEKAAIADHFKQQDIDVKKAKELLAANEAAVLDVRTQAEFAKGHIPGALQNDIRGADFVKNLASLDKDRAYVVHCAAGTPGGRSRKAVEALKAAGVKHVYHLNGGYLAWEAEQKGSNTH